MGMQQCYSTQPFCHAGVPLDCTLYLQISVLIRTLNFSSHLLLPTPLARQITPQGIQRAEVVGSESRRWGERAKRRVETLGVCWPQNQGPRGLGKVWGLRGTTRVDPEKETQSHMGFDLRKGDWLCTDWPSVSQVHGQMTEGWRMTDAGLPGESTFISCLKWSWVWSLFCFPLQSWLWFPSETSPAVSLLLSLTSSPSSLTPRSLSPQGVPSSLCTSTFHHLSSPASSPQTFPNYSNPHICKSLLPVRDPIQFSVWLLCFSWVRSQRTRRYEKVSPKRSYFQNWEDDKTGVSFQVDAAGEEMTGMTARSLLPWCYFYAPPDSRFALLLLLCHLPIWEQKWFRTKGRSMRKTQTIGTHSENTTTICNSNKSAVVVVCCHVEWL